MRNGIKAALFVSAFSPCLISIGLARLVSSSPVWDDVYYIVAGVIGSLVVLYILSAMKWHAEAFPFQAKKIESYDALLLGVVATYILPFFIRAADITVSVIIALMVGMLAVFWFTDATVPSPLLRLFGIRFYKAESASGMVYTLITGREILDPSNVKTVKRISGSMLLEVDK